MWLVRKQRRCWDENSRTVVLKLSRDICHQELQLRKSHLFVDLDVHDKISKFWGYSLVLSKSWDETAGQNRGRVIPRKSEGIQWNGIYLDKYMMDSGDNVRSSILYLSSWYVSKMSSSNSRYRYVNYLYLYITRLPSVSKLARRCRITDVNYPVRWF